jgi:hypothetical protein
MGKDGGERRAGRAGKRWMIWATLALIMVEGGRAYRDNEKGGELLEGFGAKYRLDASLQEKGGQMDP